MNPYTTRSRFRIQPRDLEAIVGAQGFLAAPHIVALERQRSQRSEAEVARLLKEHSVARTLAAPRVTMVRQAIGAALVRAGQRLAAAPPGGASPASELSDGMLLAAS